MGIWANLVPHPPRGARRRGRLSRSAGAREWPPAPWIERRRIRRGLSRIPTARAGQDIMGRRADVLDVPRRLCRQPQRPSPLAVSKGCRMPSFLAARSMRPTPPEVPGAIPSFLSLHRSIGGHRRRQEKRASDGSGSLSSMGGILQQGIASPGLPTGALSPSSGQQPRRHGLRRPGCGTNATGPKRDRLNTAPCNVHGKRPDWYPTNFQPCFAKPAGPRGSAPMTGTTISILLQPPTYLFALYRTCVGGQPGLADWPQ